MKKVTKEVHKRLSPNDLGLTGSHQAGILVPKSNEILSFFPALDIKTLNPRVRLLFEDASDCRWFLNFIYYNNRHFGGTRNEYRLTGLTGFYRQYCLVVGDSICLFLDEDENRYIGFKRENELYTYTKGVLTIHSGWTVFD